MRTPDAPRSAGALDMVVVAAVALAARLPAYLYSGYLHPDDGTYGMSVVAMRDGGVPFREVFSSQGPLHLPLLFLGDLIGLRTSVAPRTTPLLAGVVAATLAVLAGRRLGGRVGGLVAGSLVALSGSLLWTTGPITSDGPSIALSLAGFLLVLRYADTPSARRAAVAALPLAAAVLVKPATSAIAALGATIVVARRRRPLDLAVMAGVATALAAVAAAPFGFGDVWDQAVRYQLDSGREQGVVANLRKLATTAWSRDLLVLAGGALGIAGATIARRRRTAGSSPARRDALLGLAVWLGTLVVFLAVEPALWRNHVSNLVVPAALLVAAARPPARWAAVALLVVLPVHLLFVRSILDPRPLPRESRAAITALRALPRDAQVVTDEVGIVWRANRRTPDDFVDASIKQFQQRRFTTARVAAAARRRDVCAVLVWRRRYLGALAGLPRALRAAGYRPSERFAGDGGARVLYLRACREAGALTSCGGLGAAIRCPPPAPAARGGRGRATAGPARSRG